MCDLCEKRRLTLFSINADLIHRRIEAFEENRRAFARKGHARLKLRKSEHLLQSPLYQPVQLVFDSSVAVLEARRDARTNFI